MLSFLAIHPDIRIFTLRKNAWLANELAIAR